MAEFKKLSEVEAVRAVQDNANVLIEENGVIKKAPKTAVGGGGGSGECAYFVTYLNIEDNPVYAATDNLFQKIQEMIASGEIKDFNIYSISDYDGSKDVQKYSLNRILDFSNTDEPRYHMECGTYNAIVFSDGRISIEYYD